MNRIVLIGNGFDLAHGLKTNYADFIDWYWEYRVHGFQGNLGYISEDPLCKIEIVNHIECWNVFSFYLPRYFNKMAGKDVVQSMIDTPSRFKVEFCPFFETIIKDIEKKGWVDIEDVYYAFLKSSGDPKQINDDLDFIKEKLVEYLNSLPAPTINPIILKQILEPINKEDIAISSLTEWENILKQRFNFQNEDWNQLISGYNLDKEISNYSTKEIEVFKNAYQEEFQTDNIKDIDARIYPTMRLPDNIMLLDFNYTNTSDMYMPKADKFSVNHIHGSLSNPKSVIFGYGDELDNSFNELLDKKDKEYLRNIKSIRYLEVPNYRNMLRFIESSPYQIYIMGHSCGNSDRTMLNTLFEHRNCVCIKPFYHKWDDGTDNYMELVQNIARNFTDMKLMRARVVNKTFCETI